MKINQADIILVILMLFSGFANCQSALPDNLTGAKNNQPEHLDIYLLIGQSNMAGRATIELADEDTLENVFLFQGIENMEWERAANPLNKYSTIRKDIKMQKLGPGYSFARDMAKYSTGEKIGLVVNARGGTKIELWVPGTE